MIDNHVGCVNSAAEIIGNKWSAQIIRELADSPKRYCEIERGVSGINPRILSQRLEALENHGIITEISHAYQLTTKGHDLLPILKKMADWGEKYPRDPSWNIT